MKMERVRTGVRISNETETAKADSYNSLFTSCLRKLAGLSLPGCGTFGSSPFAQFERAGFPTVQQEEWKYTNVSTIAKTNFRPVIAANGTGLATGDKLAPFSYEETRNSVFVFVNGIFRSDLSSVKSLAAITAIKLDQALQDPNHEP
jgi:hypothetical protein